MVRDMKNYKMDIMSTIWKNRKSNDERYRYLLYKIWERKLSICTVLTMYPNLVGILSLDLITALIFKQLSSENK